MRNYIKFVNAKIDWQLGGAPYFTRYFAAIDGESLAEWIAAQGASVAPAPDPNPTVKGETLYLKLTKKSIVFAVAVGNIDVNQAQGWSFAQSIYQYRHDFPSAPFAAFISKYVKERSPRKKGSRG